MNTVKELRQEGREVRCVHFRYVNDKDGNPQLRPAREIREEEGSLKNVNARGGRILVEITDTDGTKHYGDSKCLPSDSFNASVGRKIAIGRALNTRTKVGKTAEETEWYKEAAYEYQLALRAEVENITTSAAAE